MSTTEPTTGGSILRPQAKSLGSRRLPLTPSADEPSSPTSVPGKPDLSSLRHTFAEELATLEQEVHARALAEARQLAERELAAAREKLQTELSTELEGKLQTQQKALEQQREQLVQLIQAVEAQRDQMTRAMEPVVGRLTLAVVLRLLGRHIAEHVLVADLATHAVEQYRLGSPLRIRVAEADYRNILAGSDDQALKDSLQVDHDAVVGSCVIDFGAGQLDAGLDAQLEELKAALLGERNAGGGRVGAL
jgi:flagellar biosynthesis/type III secretory pathway protein FliH